MRCDGRWRREISFFTASKISADAKGNSHEAKQKRDPSVIQILYRERATSCDQHNALRSDKHRHTMACLQPCPFSLSFLHMLIRFRYSEKKNSAKRRQKGKLWKTLYYNTLLSLYLAIFLLEMSLTFQLRNGTRKRALTVSNAVADFISFYNQFFSLLLLLLPLVTFSIERE